MGQEHRDLSHKIDRYSSLPSVEDALARTGTYQLLRICAKRALTLCGII